MTPEEQILALDKEWCDRFQTGDVDWIMEHLADDARLLIPGMAPVIGREQMEQTWKALVRNTDLTFSWRADFVRVSDAEDLAYVTGEVSLTESGKAQCGKYAVTWGKEDGRWKIMLDIFNTH